MRDLYTFVSSRILSELETGSPPWIKPWSATAGANVPCNAISNRPYSGCNVVLLWMAASAGYTTPRYLTFKQASDAGGSVRKGEADDVRLVPMLREYTVFNVAQCEGLSDKVISPQPPKVRNHDDRDKLADEFLASGRADIREGFGEAYYRPSDDYVSLPPFAAFKSADSFYNVAFHELGHWTGHKSRLDRDLRNRFGDRQYAAEELVAELAAAFLCAEFGFDNDLRHAGYIAIWIELLKADKRAFFTAASKAQAAADYLRSLALAEPVRLAA